MRKTYYLSTILLSVYIAIVKPVYSDTRPQHDSNFSVFSSEMPATPNNCKGLRADITISHINNQKLQKNSIINGEFVAKGWEISIMGLCTVSGYESCTKQPLNYQTPFTIHDAIAPGKKYMLIPDPTEQNTSCEVKIENKPS